MDNFNYKLVRAEEELNVILLPELIRGIWKGTLHKIQRNGSGMLNFSITAHLLGKEVSLVFYFLEKT